jgi:hypothetical protein
MSGAFSWSSDLSVNNLVTFVRTTKPFSMSSLGLYRYVPSTSASERCKDVITPINKHQNHSWTHHCVQVCSI